MEGTQHAMQAVQTLGALSLRLLMEGPSANPPEGLLGQMWRNLQQTASSLQLSGSCLNPQDVALAKEVLLPATEALHRLVLTLAEGLSHEDAEAMQRVQPRLQAVAEQFIKDVDMYMGQAPAPTPVPRLAAPQLQEAPPVVETPLAEQVAVPRAAQPESEGGDDAGLSSQQIAHKRRKEWVTSLLCHPNRVNIFTNDAAFELHRYKCNQRTGALAVAVKVVCDVKKKKKRQPEAQVLQEAFGMTVSEWKIIHDHWLQCENTRLLARQRDSGAAAENAQVICKDHSLTDHQREIQFVTQLLCLPQRVAIFTDDAAFNPYSNGRKGHRFNRKKALIYTHYAVRKALKNAPDLSEVEVLQQVFGMSREEWDTIKLCKGREERAKKGLLPEHPTGQPETVQMAVEDASQPEAAPLAEASTSEEDTSSSVEGEGEDSGNKSRKRARKAEVVE